MNRITAALLVVFVAACGATASPITAAQESGPRVVVSPGSVTLAPGATRVFTAAVTPAGSVTWSVVGLGAVNPVGPSATTTYTAPTTTGGPHRVVATVAGTGVSGYATVTVAQTYSISGTVSGDTAQGVTMTLSGADTGTTTTGAGGTYTFTGVANGSYTVRPSKAGYTFAPPSVSFAVNGGNVTGRDFTATLIPAGDLGDVPPWVAEMPTLSNGMKWMPGVPGGIPAGTVDTTLTTVTASTINSALAAASGRGSPSNIRVVQLPAGTFSISGNITPQNYTVLRGAGAGGGGRTRLNFSGGSIESNDTSWSGVPLTDMGLAPSATLPVGSTQVTVASATGFAVDDLIQLDQLDDLSYVSILDAGFNKRSPFRDGPYHGPISPNGFRSVASMHRVTAVNGTTLTIDPPTRIDYTYYSQADGTTRLYPQVWRVSRRGTSGIWYAGVEQLSMAGPQQGGIVFHAGAYNWVKDVETDGSANGGISNDHIRFEHQFRSEIRRVYAHHTTGGPTQGGANYGINLNAATSECLLIDSISTYMNKPVQTNCAGPGNVIAYNYVDNTSANGGPWMDGAINGSHQSFTHHLLVEGNWSANIGCDTTHGNSGYMMFLRNYGAGRSTNYANSGNLRAANTDGWQREMGFAGNVLFAGGAGGIYEATGSASGSYSVWSIGQNVWGEGSDWDTNTSGTQNTVIGGVPYPPRNNMRYDDTGSGTGTLWDGRQPTFSTNARSKLWRHGNWDSVHGSIFDWNAGYPAHAIAVSLFLPSTSSPPDFFLGNTWPWIEPTATTAGGRVAILPAKARYDASTPFATP